MSGLAIVPQPVPHAPRISPFQPKPAEYSVTDVVFAFFKEKAKDLAKAGNYLSFWSLQAMPDLPKSVGKFGTTLKDFKNFIAVTEVPQKLYEVGRDIVDLTENTSNGVVKGVRKLFKDSMSTVTSLADTVEFAKIFLPINNQILKWVSNVNFAALAGFAGHGVIEQAENIANNTDCDLKKNTLYCLNLARDVSYLALGVLGVTFAITGAALTPWLIVACATSGLAFSIGTFFYERLVDPENKGKNLNPAIVVENLVAQRAHEARAAAPAA